jgi:Family of unknown function (DUF5317)
MLTTVVVAVVVAVVARARGGSLEALSSTTLRFTGFLFAGLGLQLLFEFWEPAWMTAGPSLALVLVSNLLVVVFLLANRRTPGILLAAAGLVLNVLVITVNGSMPVSETAIEVAGIDRSRLDAEDLKHEAMTEDTVLPWLGDVIPVPAVGEVLSAGDVLLTIGIGWLIYARMTSERRAATPIRRKASG